MRCALLESVSHNSLSLRALPFVLEELESASDPRLTAVAAAALRKSPEPQASFVQPILQGLQAIHEHDAPVLVGQTRTTATDQMLLSLRWLVEARQYPLTELHLLANSMLRLKDADALLRGVFQPNFEPPRNEADVPVTPVFRRIPPRLADLVAEDHAHTRITLRDLFQGRTTLVFFFFTRCANPMKCPLTVAKLARLHGRIARARLPIRTAAFTYDPAYDTSERLMHYARSWGAMPSVRHRFLRVPRSFGRMRDFFQLGVGYGPAGVNRHQLEVFVVDRHLTLIAGVLRRQWNEEQLLAIAEEAG
jgi:protein SCO1/2